MSVEGFEPPPLSFSSHPASHLRHHVHTHDPNRGPDHFAAGPLIGVIPAQLGQVVIISLLRVFALICRLIPRDTPATGPIIW